MSEYVYVEYPKCLYRGEETVTVRSRGEEDECANEGWVTAEAFYAVPVQEIKAIDMSEIGEAGATKKKKK